MLHLRALSEGERILDVDAEVADCALDLRMAERAHGKRSLDRTYRGVVLGR